jgi:hypothetical protein
MKANEVGRACGTMGQERKCTRFWCENPKERDRSEDRGVDGKMGLEWILGWGMAGVCGLESVGSG